jgi:hypothetical protein
MLLYMTLKVQDSSLQKMLHDFYRRETDVDFFLTYLRAKADDTLSQLLLHNGCPQDSCDQIFASISQGKSTKVFTRFAEKLSKPSKTDQVAKLVAKLQKKFVKAASTQNSERIIHGANASGAPFSGGLRQSPREFNQRQIESNFQMIYYGEFLTKEKEEGAIVKKLFAE